MIIWINRPFGGGKTQTAFELRRRLAGAVVCDPERIGAGLHRAMPPVLRADFQNLASWRSGTIEVLDLVGQRHPGPVIVPMTVYRPSYFDEVVGGLRRRGHDLRHFSLMADRATVVRRLRERSLVGGPRANRSALNRLDPALDHLAEPAFAEQIHTDDLPVPRVAEAIAHRCGLDIGPDTSGPLTRLVRRGVVKVRHVHWR